MNDKKKSRRSSRSRSRDRRDRRDRDRESRKGRIEENDINIKEEPTWKDEVNVKEEPMESMGYDGYAGGYGDYDDSGMRKIKEERANMMNDPLMFALSITDRDNKALSDYINSVLNEEGEILEND